MYFNHQKMNFLYKITVCFLFLFLSLNSYSQECNCGQILSNLQKEIEQNQASFQHQVIEKNNEKNYILFKNQLNKKAVVINSKNDCIGLISIYLSFIKDEHSFIAHLENSIPQKQHIIRPIRLKKSQKTIVDGIWYFEDGTFSIQVFPHASNLGTRVGVISKTEAKNWKKNQVKIEFFTNEMNQIYCVYWRNNLIPKSFPVFVTDSTMKIGRNLTFYREKPKKKESTFSNQNIEFRTLSKQTNYLKIPSFDLHFKEKIDSIIEVHKVEFESKENLIIDLRNNGGGGFDAFFELLPYCLDSKYVETPYYASVWVSKDNFNYYDKTKFDYTETKQDSIDELNYIEFLAKYKNQFSPISKHIDTIELNLNAPKSIAILINRNTASSAEGFVMQVKNSKKVHVFGENSAGAITYGDWRPLAIPELGIWVAMTTKKMIFNEAIEIESIGIQPHYDLSNYTEREWIQLLINQLEDKSK